MRVSEGIHGERERRITFRRDHGHSKPRSEFLTFAGARAGAVLDSFARMLSRRIGETARAPAVLAKLPIERRVAHSEQYVRKVEEDRAAAGIGAG